LRVKSSFGSILFYWISTLSLLGNAKDSIAKVVELTFNEVDFGTTLIDPLPVDAYSAFGIEMSNFYWGTDARDPFGDSQRSVAGIFATTPRIDFQRSTPFVEFQYWTVSPSIRVLARAFSAQGLDVGSFSGPGTWSDGGGEARIAGPRIDYITFLCQESTGVSYGCGSVALSTLRYVQPRVPEPGTLALLGLGLAGLGLSRRRRA
jgi:hypothetical protein